MVNELVQTHAIKCFIGALYFRCGFQHRWYRRPGKSYPTRLECLLSKISELQKFGLTESDLEFFAGPQSPYWICGNEIYPAGTMKLREAALSLEIWSNKPEYKELNGAFLAAFHYMTGYETYEACYTNDDEKRIIAEDGIGDERDFTIETEKAWRERTEGGFKYWVPF